MYSTTTTMALTSNRRDLIQHALQCEQQLLAELGDQFNATWYGTGSNPIECKAGIAACTDWLLSN